eukprot:520231_1
MGTSYATFCLGEETGKGDAKYFVAGYSWWWYESELCNNKYSNINDKKKHCAHYNDGLSKFITITHPKSYKSYGEDCRKDIWAAYMQALKDGDVPPERVLPSSAKPHGFAHEEFYNEYNNENQYSAVSGVYNQPYNGYGYNPTMNTDFAVMLPLILVILAVLFCVVCIVSFVVTGTACFVFGSNKKKLIASKYERIGSEDQQV